ncbi:family 43 glycosylhydrolase [Panacibacter sp. DH6]|uniref:Family 43 glycosylhydrolase n=2 Tax=Panacibacter microcysteis TaxID=2793269 RepID=A0A931GU65_9BACT|nr:family 43 glycosylhydrolase [Panacibacter microcysteis]
MHKRMKIFLVSYLVVLFMAVVNTVMAQDVTHTAPAPLYRDPVTDGAADPVMVWNRAAQKWWMLYTQRRANTEAPGVSFCYGNDIAVACGEDSGRTWVYRGTLNLAFEEGRNTYWAPEVVYHEGVYHMFVVYIQGVRSEWGGKARMAHYTSNELWQWKFIGFVTLSSEQVIDASLMQMPDGTWRMWYKDDARNAAIMMAESKDLFTWTYNNEPVLGNTAQEGPKVFAYNHYYWMLTDEWRGMRVYRSADAIHWEKQGLILDSASARKDDQPGGAHGDVVVVNDKAWVFYFTHPGRIKHGEAHMDANGIYPFSERRSSIQVAPLQFANGTLVSDRSRPFVFSLPALKNK